MSLLLCSGASVLSFVLLLIIIFIVLGLHFCQVLILVSVYIVFPLSLCFLASIVFFLSSSRVQFFILELLFSSFLFGMDILSLVTWVLFLVITYLMCFAFNSTSLVLFSQVSAVCSPVSSSLRCVHIFSVSSLKPGVVFCQSSMLAHVPGCQCFRSPAF